ncbi:MAG: MarR family transcriptional regulator [Bacteroidota bacterium]
MKPIGRELAVIGKSYLHALNLMLNSLDIERNFYALLLIENAECKITQQQLACQLEIDKVSMLRSIDYLSENGYVQRIKNNLDKRTYSLELTPKARMALPEIKKAYDTMNQIALKGLSKQQIAELSANIKIIKTNLNEYTSSL